MGFLRQIPSAPDGSELILTVHTITGSTEQSRVHSLALVKKYWEEAGFYGLYASFNGESGIKPEGDVALLLKYFNNIVKDRKK